MNSVVSLQRMLHPYLRTPTRKKLAIPSPDTGLGIGACSVGIYIKIVGRS